MANDYVVHCGYCDTCLCACAFQQRARDRETAHCVVPGGGVWVAVTREFERDNCVTSEILQSDWTIPNRAGVPRKSTKVPRPSFVRETREGLGPRLWSEEVRQGQVNYVIRITCAIKMYGNRFHHCTPRILSDRLDGFL